MTTQLQTRPASGMPGARAVERRERVRLALTLSLAGSAGIHLALAPHHGEHSSASGISFVVAAVAMVATAMVVALRRDRASVAAGAVLLAGAIALYGASLLTPVPVVAPHVEGPGVVGVIAKLVELTGLAAAVWLLAAPRVRATSANGMVASLMPVVMTVVAAAYATRALGH